MKRAGSLILIIVLTACGAGASQCPEGSGPETVTVDASAYSARGPLRICVRSQQEEPPACSENGLALTVTLQGSYARTVDYGIYASTESKDLQLPIREGDLSLTCNEAAISVSFGTPSP